MGMVLVYREGNFMSLSKKPSGMSPMGIPQGTGPLPHARDSIKEAHALRNVPRVGPAFLTRWLLRLVSARLHLGTFLRASTHNIYFTTSYLLAVIGLVSYFRFYYRDQIRRYGLAEHAPGFAESLQTQNVATFKAVTLPLVLDTTARLFPTAARGAMASRSDTSMGATTPTTSLARFAVTPFVDRVDVYPESLLIQFTPAWADYMGRHFYVTYPLATEGRRGPESPFDPMRTSLMVGATPTSFPASAQFGFGTTRPRSGFADPWAAVRGLLEVQDVFPTQLETTTARHVNRPHVAPSPSDAPSVLAPVHLWTDLPIPAGPPQWTRVYNPDAKAAFAFTPSSTRVEEVSSSMPALGLGALDAQHRALQQEFFHMSVSSVPSPVGLDAPDRPAEDPTALREAHREAHRAAKPQAGRRRLRHIASRSASRSAYRPDVDHEPQSHRPRRLGTIYTDILPSMKDLRRVARGPRHVRPPQVPTFDALFYAQGVVPTQRTRYDVRGWFAQVRIQSRTVLTQLQRTFFSSKAYQAKVEALAAKPPELETPLERLERQEARARVLAERQAMLNAHADFQIYRTASRQYRKARHRARRAQRAYRRVMARIGRREGGAFRRYHDARLFWRHTLPHLILTDLPGVHGSTPGFIADATQRGVHVWQHALALMDRVQAHPAPQTELSPAGIGQFIRFAMWPTHRNASQSASQSHMPSIPFNATATAFPPALLEELQRLDAEGGYAAFYDVLAACGLSAGSTHARPAAFNAHVVPGVHHFQPIRTWLEAVIDGTRAATTPFEKPRGNEYHWALTMQRVLSSPEGLETLQQQLQHVRPAPLAHATDATAGRPTVPFIVEKLHHEVHAYIDAVQAALSLRLQAATHVDDVGYRYARALSDLHSFMSCVDHVETQLERRLMFGARRQVTQALSTLLPPAYPTMHGFAFPDATSDALYDAWVQGAHRYHLTWRRPWLRGAKSQWHVFTTLFQRRPMEIPVPAGYRFFMEHVFSTTADREANREASRRDNREPLDTTVALKLPPYTFERHVAYYPFYTDLQALYGDLDVSFLPEKPVPKGLYASFNFEAQGFTEPYLVHSKSESAITVPRALQRDSRTGDVVVTPRDRARVTRFVEYVFSSANWLKDRPANFRGLSARLLGEPTNQGLDQAQASIANMGTAPDFASDTDFLQIDAQAKAVRSVEFPLQLHGYRRDAFFCPNFETLRPTEKDFFVEQHELERTRVVGSPSMLTPPRGWVGWFHQSRELPQLTTRDRLYIPRLSLDEWHALFRTCLQTAKDAADPEFMLDVPVLAFHGLSVAHLRSHSTIMTAPTSRSALLTQMLLAIMERNYGAYDLLGYDNPAGTVQTFMAALASQSDTRSAPASIRHMPRPLRLVSHMAVPTRDAQADPLGAPTFLDGSSWRRPSHGRGRWTAADMYMRNLLSGSMTLPWNPEVRPAAIPKYTLFHAMGEPITAYWWLALAQFVFYVGAWHTLRFVALTSWDELKPLMLQSFGSRRLRALFLQLGLVHPFTYRIVRDHTHTFASSAGALNTKLFMEACESVVHLRNQCRPGASMARGFLFTGIPGTGKTYMVQMIAGEARVPVVTQTAAELFNPKTNAGLSIAQTMTPAEQLRVAFARARALAPSILFIDEIDALGAARVHVMMGGLEPEPDPTTDLYGYLRVARRPAHAALVPHISLKERSLREIFTKTTLEQVRKPQYVALSADPYPGERPLRTDGLFAYKDAMTKRANQQVGALTEFLVQMDGLRPLDGVLVIGATNRPHVLDPALTRPGRLERVIELHPPGARERLDIFKNECQKLGVVSGIAWNYLVNRTRGLTVANLTTAINHSALHSIRLHRRHTLDSLEYGLDTMLRHKRAMRMMSVRPMPSAVTCHAHDPYTFARVAYYNAGKALLHAVLPQHPPLAYVKLAVEPFEPDYTIRDLFVHNYTRTELEIRLIGLHAGKAAEYLMLYGTKPDGVLPTALHLLESDQGSDELAFASELAHAMVDEWFLYEHTRQPIKLAIRENDTARNLCRSRYVETYESLQYWMDMRAKTFTRLPSDRDQPAVDLNSKSIPPGHTIHQRYEELAYWSTRLSRIDLSALTHDYIQWYQYYLRPPFRNARSRFWLPPDVYYHQEPAIDSDYDALVAAVTAVDGRADVTWQTIDDDWDAQVRAWDPTRTVLPDSQRPMVTFRDWHLIDRDYLMQSLMGISFETALNLLHEFRPLLDTIATHLLNTRIVRQDVLATYIREYTQVRRQSGAPTPITLMDFTSREAFPGLQSTPSTTSTGAFGAPDDGCPPLIAPIEYARPASDFERADTPKYVLYERAWGPHSRKPFGKKVPLWYFNNPNILRPTAPAPDFAAASMDALQRSGADPADDQPADV